MAVSTLFSDSKFSNQLGGVMLILPLGAYMYFMSTGIDSSDKFSASYWVIYFFYWIPIIPTCSLIINLADAPS